MSEPGAFTTAAPEDAFCKPDSGRRIAAAWMSNPTGAFTNAPPVGLALRPGNSRRDRGARVMLFGAALLLLCAVGLSGCGGGMEEEPLEQGEWLVCSGRSA